MKKNIKFFIFIFLLAFQGLFCESLTDFVNDSKDLLPDKDVIIYSEDIIIIGINEIFEIMFEIFSTDITTPRRHHGYRTTHTL